MKKRVIVLFVAIIMIMFSSCDENTNQSDFTWTNSQKVIVNNIEFHIPQYFDVLSEESTDSYKHFYPEQKDYYCSLILEVYQINDWEQEIFDENKSEILASAIEKKYGKELEVIESEEKNIAGFSGWSETVRTLRDEANSTITVSVSYDYEKKTVFFVSLVVDDADQSDFDYFGDYERILEFTKILDVKATTQIPEKSSVYEKAYMRPLTNYTLYYMFDEDTKKVVAFGTNDTYVMEGTYSGSFENGVTISWDDGWNETFKHSGGNKAILIDVDGFDWEYEVCDVAKAQMVLDGLK